MNNRILNSISGNGNQVRDSRVEKFMTSVYMWTFAGLAVSGLFAYMFASITELKEMIYTVDSLGQYSFTFMGWVTLLLPIALVIFIVVKMDKMSKRTLQKMYIIYASIMGISLSSIFLRYDIGTISIAFFVTSGTFLVMSVIGYTTKIDLTKLGSLLMMGLIGVIIAMLANMIIGSSMIDYIISCVAVVVFVGLIAYDTQKIKAFSYIYDEEKLGKAAILGALSLYLNFINLLLHLLSLMGDD